MTSVNDVIAALRLSAKILEAAQQEVGVQGSVARVVRSRHSAEKRPSNNKGKKRGDSLRVVYAALLSKRAGMTVAEIASHANITPLAASSRCYTYQRELFEKVPGSSPVRWRLTAKAASKMREMQSGTNKGT